MSQTETPVEKQQSAADLREALKNGTTAHPVLTRLIAKLDKANGASEVITSYSRMHHRHNRD
jgi:hypothetical protein